MKGNEEREEFVESHISKGIAYQVRSLRGRDGITQEQLAERAGTTQNMIYRIENPRYGKQTLTTLKKVAAAFDVALIVRFVPYSQLVDWVSGTPRTDPGLTHVALAVPSFIEECGFKLSLGSAEDNQIVLGERPALPSVHDAANEAEQQESLTGIDVGILVEASQTQGQSSAKEISL